MFTAVLGLLGGFATPVALSTGVDRPLGLFSYLLLLNLGLAAVALQRRWHPLVMLAVACTFLLEVGWFFRFMTPEKMVIGLGAFRCSGSSSCSCRSWRAGTTTARCVGGRAGGAGPVPVRPVHRIASRASLASGRCSSGTWPCWTRRSRPSRSCAAASRCCSAGALATALMLPLWAIPGLDRETLWGPTLAAIAIAVLLNAPPRLASLLGRGDEERGKGLAAAGVIGTAGPRLVRDGAGQKGLGDRRGPVPGVAVGAGGAPDRTQPDGPLGGRRGRGRRGRRPARAVLVLPPSGAGRRAARPGTGAAPGRRAVDGGRAAIAPCGRNARGRRRRAARGRRRAHGPVRVPRHSRARPRARCRCSRRWPSRSCSSLHAMWRRGWADRRAARARGRRPFTSRCWQVAYFQPADVSFVLPAYAGVRPRVPGDAVRAHGARAGATARCCGPRPRWRCRRSSCPIHRRSCAVWGKGWIGALPVAMAAVSVVALALVARRFPSASDAVANGRCGCATSRSSRRWRSASWRWPIPLQLDRQWITVGWALLAAAVCWLFGRLPHPGLKYVALALFAAVGVRLLANDEVLPLPGARTADRELAALHVRRAGAVRVRRRLAACGAPRRRAATSPRSTGCPGDRSLAPVVLAARAAARLRADQRRDLRLLLGGAVRRDRRSSAQLARDLTMSVAWGLYAVVLLRHRHLAADEGAALSRARLPAAHDRQGVPLRLSASSTGSTASSRSSASAVSLILVSLLYQRFVVRQGGRRDDPRGRRPGCWRPPASAASAADLDATRAAWRYRRDVAGRPARRLRRARGPARAARARGARTCATCASWPRTARTSPTSSTGAASA